jgi:hypothetical protein
LVKVRADFDRAKPKGRPDLQDRTPIALLPAIAKLKTAKDAFDVRMILDQVPANIYAPLAIYVSGRPGRFTSTIVSECVRVAGVDRIRQMVGKQKASSIIQRYMRT